MPSTSAAVTVVISRSTRWLWNGRYTSSLLELDADHAWTFSLNPIAADSTRHGNV